MNNSNDVLSTSHGDRLLQPALDHSCSSSDGDEQLSSPRETDTIVAAKLASALDAAETDTCRLSLGERQVTTVDDDDRKAYSHFIKQMPSCSTVEPSQHQAEAPESTASASSDAQVQRITGCASNPDPIADVESANGSSSNDRSQYVHDVHSAPVVAMKSVQATHRKPIVRKETDLWYYLTSIQCLIAKILQLLEPTDATHPSLSVQINKAQRRTQSILGLLVGARTRTRSGGVRRCLYLVKKRVPRLDRRISMIEQMTSRSKYMRTTTVKQAEALKNNLHYAQLLVEDLPNLMTALQAVMIAELRLTRESTRDLVVRQGMMAVSAPNNNLG